MDTLGSRIKYIRGEDTHGVFAKRAGISKSSISGYEKGDNSPSADVVLKICSAYNISVEWLMTGHGPIHPLVGMKQPKNEEAENPQNGNAPLEIQEDVISIPIVEARLSAGLGSLQVNNSIDGQYTFPAQFLYRRGSPNNMIMMRVDGDSMQPEIMDGDIVLIDQSKKDIRLGRIFAVGFEEAIYLKRIDMLPGKILLKSVNPAYPPVEIDMQGQIGDSFRVIGQVLWVGREYQE